VGLAPRRRQLALVGALGTVYLVWGSTYLGIAVALETVPPLVMTAVRFLLAGAILYLLATRGGDRRARPTGGQWLAATITGVPLFLVGNGGVVWAQQTVASGIAALLIATVPLWIALLDRLAFGGRLSRKALIGLVLGFAGLALLVNPGGPGEVDPLGATILAVAAFGWSVGSLLSRGATLPESALLTASMQMLAGGSACAVAVVVSGELGELRPAEVSGRSLVALLYLVVFGSLLAFSAYAWLLRTTRTSLVATYAYVNPIVAVALGWAVLGEEVTGRTLVAGGIIVLAVALIVGGPTPHRAPERSREQAPRQTGDRSHAEAATRGS
jgi:drug/metabolite transporter (DMT)-like permease